MLICIAAPRSVFCMWNVLDINRHPPHSAPPSGLGEPDTLIFQTSGTSVRAGHLMEQVKALSSSARTAPGSVFRRSGLWSSFPVALPDLAEPRLCKMWCHWMADGALQSTIAGTPR